MGETTNLKNVLLISVFLVATTCSIAAGRTIYVDDDGPADFSNIQAAIDDSSHGDTIIVNPGTYTGAGNRDIDYNGKAITVRSMDPNDPNIVASTIIDCNGTEEEPHRGFYFNAGEEANSVLAGLTITNGFSDYGGGIYCEASRPTIINCTLVANSALLGSFRSFNRRGGGITCRFCKLDWPSLPTKATNPRPSDGSIYVRTTADLEWTAGIFAESHDVYFGTNNPPPFVCNQTSTIFDPGTMVTDITYYWRIDELNTLGKTIGTLWSFAIGDSPFPFLSALPSGEIEEQLVPEIFSDTALQGPTITNCIFNDNVAGEGGGIYTQQSNPILNNCTFSGNEGFDGGGMFTEGSNLTLVNCTLSGNSATSIGGGLLCADSNTMLTNCSLSGNSSDHGGGIFNWYDSNTTLTDCIFSDNFASLSGGGMFNDGYSHSNLTNCTFTGNSTHYGDMSWEGGGGIYNRYCTSKLIGCKFIQNSSYRGGGILSLNDINTVLIDCIFNENSAGTGGGVYSVGSSEILINCMFSGNSASNKGGGMYNAESNSTLKNCTFTGNVVEYIQGSIIIIPPWPPYSKAICGGGMYNEYCNPILTNCSFSGNLVICFLGPYYSYPVYCFGGAMYNYQSGAKLINCTFAGNWASEKGGAIRWQYPGSPPPPLPPYFTGSAITGGGLAENLSITDFNDSNVPMISNCIFWDNRDSNGMDELAQISVDPNETQIIINYNCIQGWTGDLGGTGNIDANPCFVQPGFWISDMYIYDDWFEGYYQLLPESPCIDAGDPNYIAEPNETDLDGNPRVIAGRIDMGAYEFNHVPVADAGPDQTVEAQGHWGATVTLDGSGSSDADSTPGTNDDIVYFDWYKVDPCDPNADVFLGSGQIIDCNLPIGEHIILLEVIDKASAYDTNEVTIIVQDTTPPQFQLSVAPTMLWPPDHKMVEITPSWTVSDECDASPDVSLVGIVANEGDDTIGDGHTSNDIQIGEDGSIYLRSERSGTSGDRIYTITYQAVDDCGNTTVRSATVSIPHDFRVLARIAARWLWANRAGRIPEDLNGDGVVNLKDIAIFANNWIQ